MCVYMNIYYVKYKTLCMHACVKIRFVCLELLEPAAECR